MHKAAVANFLGNLRCMPFIVSPKLNSKPEIRPVVFQLSFADKERAKLRRLFKRDIKFQDKNIMLVVPFFSPPRASSDERAIANSDCEFTGASLRSPTHIFVQSNQKFAHNMFL